MSAFVVLSKFLVMPGIAVGPQFVGPWWWAIEPGEYTIGGGGEAFEPPLDDVNCEV